ncbi:hypothetical protein FDP41_009715 [Naegleria fowleri]|uniref:Uncharacterized protein n=1 Tax=Naegleria fowleri TaxID=5763 RepID=A0A6A5BG46_NAEFO|nr:uncharacterized protein FDP41_009715 [Naegleria fowleri]KAF0972019.1 hypothetical protein FDP41_009715 [Naegleria fowleri]CAG4711674.1 unnamed protein product [Naegleria fowleri]
MISNDHHIWLSILCEHFDELNPTMVHEYYSNHVVMGMTENDPHSNIMNEKTKKKKRNHYSPSIMNLFFKMKYFSNHPDELHGRFLKERSNKSLNPKSSSPILFAVASSGGFTYAEGFCNQLIYQYFSEEYDPCTPMYFHGEREIEGECITFEMDYTPLLDRYAPLNVAKLSGIIFVLLLNRDFVNLQLSATKKMSTSSALEWMKELDDRFKGFDELVQQVRLEKNEILCTVFQ